MICVAICAGLLAPQASQLISFDRPAARLEQLLPELSGVAGVRFEAGSMLRDEVMILRFRNWSVDRTMKEIATATASGWEKFEGGYRLVPDPAKRREELAQEQKFRAQILGQAIAKEQARLAALPAYDPEKEAREQNARIERLLAGDRGTRFVPPTGTPSERAITEILRKIGVEKLSQIVPGRRTVFATPANRVQLALSPTLVAPARQFAAQTVAFRDAQNRNKNPNETVVFMSSGGSMADRGDLTKGVAKVILVTKVEPNLSAVSSTLKTFDPDGNLIAVGTHRLNLELPAVTGKPSTEAAKFSSLAKELAGQTTPRSQENRVMMVRSNGGANSTFVASDGASGSTPPSAALASFLRAPDKNEPLSLGVGELVQQQFRGQDLVAVIPDDSVDAVHRRIASGLLNLGEDTDRLLRSAGIATKIEADVVRVLPVQPSVARQSRVRRSVLAVETKQLASSGFLPLENAARLLLTGSESQDLGPVAKSALVGLNGSEYSRVFGNGDTLGIRLFGLLPASTRQSMLQGQALPVNRMLPAQVKVLLDSLLNRDVSPGSFGMAVRTTTISGVPPTKQTADIWDEPSERFANGLPANGSLALSTSTEDALWVFDGKSQRTLASLGTVGFGQSKGKFATETFLVAQVVKYNFRLREGSSEISQAEARDVASPTNASPTPFANLPAQLRQQIAEMASLFGNVMRDRTGVIKP